MLTHPKAVAVGETGLDYFRDYAPRDAQQRLFERELAIALETGVAELAFSLAAGYVVYRMLRDGTTFRQAVVETLSVEKRAENLA